MLFCNDLIFKFLLDKNKKAALLVLGKANRNQSQPQKMKVMLKKKIVKKAIKQSTCTSIRAVSIFRFKVFYIALVLLYLNLN